MYIVRMFIWDDFNVSHLGRHDVTLEEVQQVCRCDPLAQEIFDRRVRLIGPTKGGRLLTVILAPWGNGAYYPITAHPANRRQKHLYEAAKGPKGEQIAVTDG